MEERTPRFVFYRPEILDLEEVIIPFRGHERLERLEHMSEVHVPCIIFAPAGIGVSCKIALEHFERTIMIVVCHEVEPMLNDKILFGLSELIKRPQDEMMTAIERLMVDDSLQPHVFPFVAQEHYLDCETFIDLKVINTKPQRPTKPLNKVFNSQSRQNIKRFIRKK